MKNLDYLQKGFAIYLTSCRNKLFTLKKMKKKERKMCRIKQKFKLKRIQETKIYNSILKQIFFFYYKF